MIRNVQEVTKEQHIEFLKALRKVMEEHNVISIGCNYYGDTYGIYDHELYAEYLDWKEMIIRDNSSCVDTSELPK